MVEVLAPPGEISGGIETGEGLEVMDKMRLVEITASQGDIGPIERLSAADAVQDLLEALDSAKQLRRQPNFGPEKLDKPPPAETDLFDDVADRARVRPILEFLQQEGNSGMARQGPGCLCQEYLFKGREFGLRRGRCEQSLAQIASFRSPQGVKGYMHIVQFVGR